MVKGGRKLRKARVVVTPPLPSPSQVVVFHNKHRVVEVELLLDRAYLHVDDERRCFGTSAGAIIAAVKEIFSVDMRRITVYVSEVSYLKFVVRQLRKVGYEVSILSRVADWEARAAVSPSLPPPCAARPLAGGKEVEKNGRNIPLGN